MAAGVEGVWARGGGIEPEPVRIACPRLPPESGQGTSGVEKAMVTTSPPLTTLIGSEWIIWCLIP